MHLVHASLNPPDGIEAFFDELGDGEHGFVSDEARFGKMPLDEHLQFLVDLSEGRAPAPWVPETAYWLIDDEGQIVGLSRLRHHLNRALMNWGGHVAYYVRTAHRGKGYGHTILDLTLDEARKRNLERVLLTVHSDNEASRRVIEAAGGQFVDERVDENEGVTYGRYWIVLSE